MRGASGSHACIRRRFGACQDVFTLAQDVIARAAAPGLDDRCATSRALRGCIKQHCASSSHFLTVNAHPATALHVRLLPYTDHSSTAAMTCCKSIRRRRSLSRWQCSPRSVPYSCQNVPGQCTDDQTFGARHPASVLVCVVGSGSEASGHQLPQCSPGCRRRGSLHLSAPAAQPKSSRALTKPLQANPAMWITCALHDASCRGTRKLGLA